jgi:hypothetical protein
MAQHPVFMYQRFEIVAEVPALFAVPARRRAHVDSVEIEPDLTARLSLRDDLVEETWNVIDEQRRRDSTP